MGVAIDAFDHVRRSGVLLESPWRGWLRRLFFGDRRLVRGVDHLGACPVSWGLVEPYLEETPVPRFAGWRAPDGAAFVCVTVTRNGQLTRLPLPPRRDLRDHSPGGFDWGYLGSGPSQLALAMAAFCLEDDAAALAVYQWLKAEIVAEIERDGVWHLEIEEVRKFCQLAPVNPRA